VIRAPVTLVYPTPAPAGGQAADARAPLSGDAERREHDA
jgi:hypothetical protein